MLIATEYTGGLCLRGTGGGVIPRNRRISEVYRATIAKMHCSCAASYVQGERGREDCSTADDFVSKAPHSSTEVGPE
jgi:hypothetical protein